MFSARISRLFAGVVLCTIAFLTAGRSYAASIAVSSTCSLANAITAANTDVETDGCSAGSGADTITLGLNITLTAELPQITTEITIEGANYDIDGNGEYRIFYVNGGDLTINNITLTGGSGGEFGGAIKADGGSLTVTQSRLEDNEAGLLGGAIDTINADVIIKTSIFVGNSAGASGGAIAFFSSRPSDDSWTEDSEAATLLIDQVTFGEDVPAGCAAAAISADPENHAGADGGALKIRGGDTTIRRSSFIGNKADSDGGAIHASAWRMLFENNTVSCNRADGDGGGMFIVLGDMILRHSTLYENSAGDEGGGIFTIEDTAQDQANPDGLGIYLQNSIIAGSKGGGDCVSIDTINHNIGMYVGDGTCSPACSSEDGELKLGDLKGELAYHPLLDGSIAINRADQAVCELADSTVSQNAKDFTDMNICNELKPQQDQIGTIRPMYSVCDIGSIESRTGLGPREIDASRTPIATPVTSTATQVPPTATQVPPTATNVPPTATRVPPTATNVPPTATNVPPTATNRDVPPTATRVPPTATRVPPTATQNRQEPSPTSRPSRTPVPSRTSTATKPPPTIDPFFACRHAVAGGETLFQIASIYGTTVEQFRQLNQLSNDALFVGQELIIPDCYDPGGSNSFEYACQQLFDSMVVRATSRVVGCRAVDTGLIDKHPALASGMIAAVDLLGYVESGVEVCFRSIGDLVFLDAAADPPVPRPLQSYNNSMGMTCGEVDQLGTLVLVSTITEQDTYLELSSCQVTTTHTVRLRADVGSTAILSLVPFNVTLDALARTNKWFKVSFLDTEGWISASFARTSGICQ